MFLNFIAVNEKVLNLNSIALIENHSEGDKVTAVLTTTDGVELTFEGTDADALFDRLDLIVQANDLALAQITQGATA